MFAKLCRALLCWWSSLHLHSASITSLWRSWRSDSEHKFPQHNLANVRKFPYYHWDWQSNLPKKITFSLCGPRLVTNTHYHVILMCMAFRQTGLVFVFYVDLMILLKVGRVSSIKLKLVAIWSWILLVCSLIVYLCSWLSGNRVGFCLFEQACNNILKVQFPLKCANGSVELIEAYRAQHSHHRLPGTISTPVHSLVS